MRRFRLAPLLLIAMLVLVACQPGGGAAGKPAAAYKSGDKITIIVPFAAGGGYDIYTRTLQPFLETALKKVTNQDIGVVVQNVTGADGQLGVEQTYRAAPDGKQLVILGVDIAVSQQVGRKANFDLNKMAALAQINSVSRVLMVRPGVLPGDKGSFKELVERSHQKTVLHGDSGAKEIDKLTFAILKENNIDFHAEVVSFQGTSEAIASLLRGEVEVYNVTLPTAVTQVKANPSLRIMVNYGPERDPSAQDVPTLKDLGIGGADRIANTTGSSIRVFMAPPGVPDATIKQLEDAFKQAENDPEFLAKSTSLGNPVTYGDASKVRSLINENLDLYNKYKDLLGE